MATLTGYDYTVKPCYAHLEHSARRSTLGLGPSLSGKASEWKDIFAPPGILHTCWMLSSVLLFFAGAVVPSNQDKAWSGVTIGQRARNAARGQIFFRDSQTSLDHRLHHRSWTSTSFTLDTKVLAERPFHLPISSEPFNAASQAVDGYLVKLRSKSDSNRIFDAVICSVQRIGQREECDDRLHSHSGRRSCRAGHIGR